LADVNIEGFTIAPATQCTSGTKPVFWADDDETGGQAIFRGTVNCAAF
jgi:hypothetical protein